MKTLTPLILLLAVGSLLGTTGCVSQSENDDLLKVNRTLEENNLQLRNRLRGLQEERDQLLATLNEDQSAEMSKQRRIGELEAQIKELQDALAAAEQALTGMAADTGLGALDPRLAGQLEELAAQNPDLMEWDENRNMIRLRSDLTFGSGSITVKPEARQALGQLAQVLKQPAAEPYEVRVVGHTDNVPVTQRPGRRFTNNWELSAFRAISVKDVFREQGISNGRMSIAGYGEFQPVTTNGPRGSEANRRVEIFLVPQRKSSVAPEPAEDTTEPAVVDEPMEDGGVEAGDPTDPTELPDPVEFK